jgi:group II intron reverse transcriptase/maturase
VIAEKATDTRDKVRDLQRALYRAAKADAARRFHALYDKLSREDIVRRAWQEVKANAGAAGVDGQTITAIEHAGVEGLLAALATELREGTYRPHPVRRVRIPKADGRERVLGVAAVRDRVVQAAVKLVLEPVFEADFRPSSYGFRPKRSAHQALEVVRQAVNRGHTWVVDADIQAFFDEIDTDVLMRLVERRICDRRLLKLLRQWQRAGALDGGDLVPTVQGISQGSVISPLLANVVLHELDRLWEDRCGRLGQLVRYADDLVVLCRTERDAQEALRRVGLILSQLGLRLHPSKTQVVFVGDGQHGFDFLGFHCRKVASRRYRGRRYLLRWPSRRAMQRIRDRVKAITAPRRRLPEPAQVLVAELNPVLRGWDAYFRWGNSSRHFTAVDSYVRERLGLFLSKKAGRRGRDWKRHTGAYFRALGVYELAGTVAWHKATPTAVR